MFNHYIQTFTLMSVLLFYFAVASIDITKIIPIKDSDELKCNVFINDVFDSKNLSTLLSGLPVHIVIYVKLMDRNNNQVSRHQTEIIIQYDIWDEVFTIQYADNNEKYKSLDSVKKVMHSLQRISVTPLSQLNPEEDYRIFIRIHIQNEQSVSVMDSIDQDSSNKGLSLMTIIKFFFGGSATDKLWFHSDKFKLNELSSI